MELISYVSKEEFFKEFMKLNWISKETKDFIYNKQDDFYNLCKILKGITIKYSYNTFKSTQGCIMNSIKTNVNNMLDGNNINAKSSRIVRLAFIVLPLIVQNYNLSIETFLQSHETEVNLSWEDSDINKIILEFMDKNEK